MKKKWRKYYNDENENWNGILKKREKTEENIGRENMK